MAGPIRISILADAGQAVREVTHFRQTSEENVQRVVTTLGDSKMTGAFGRIQEGFDVADTRAMGFRDTITGVQDTMRGYAALTTTTEEATKRVRDAQIDYNDAVKKFGENSPQAAAASTELARAQEALEQQQGTLLDKMFLLGTGVGDLASGMANFIVPMVAMGVGLKGLALGSKAAAAGQWLLNTAMLANPITWVVVAIVALVAAIVIAYKRSETFRRIVDGAFRGVTRAAQAAWRWIKGSWPLLLAIITRPIGIAVRFVTRHIDTIQRKFRGIPRAVRSALSGARTMLTSAGRNIVQGLWNGITGLTGWLIGKVQGFIASTVPGPIRRALGIASPSKVARQIGGYFGQGLGLGLTDEESRVRRAASGLAAATIARPAGSTPSASSGTVSGAGGTLRLEASGSTASGVEALLLALIEEAARKRGGLKVRVLPV